MDHVRCELFDVNKSSNVVRLHNHSTLWCSSAVGQSFSSWLILIQRMRLMMVRWRYNVLEACLMLILNVVHSIILQTQTMGKFVKGKYHIVQNIQPSCNWREMLNFHFCLETGNRIHMHIKPTDKEVKMIKEGSVHSWGFISRKHKSYSTTETSPWTDHAAVFAIKGFVTDVLYQTGVKLTW